MHAVPAPPDDKPRPPLWALLRSGLMPIVTPVTPTRRAPSPQIGARDTALDAAANCSAGANSTPDVDGGINSATYLGKQPCRDHEDGGKDETTDREVAKHILSPQAQLALDRIYQQVWVNGTLKVPRTRDRLRTRPACRCGAAKFPSG